MTKESDNKIAIIKAEITKQLGDAETFKSLLDTTFKDLKPEQAKRAMLEGMMRGFTFENFLVKDVYAIPFGGAYNLVTSIDYSRKIGARSGIVGVDAPKYTTDEKGNIVSCAVTVKKRAGGIVGDFTAEVYFKEYSTGKNLWVSKPRTMIAKVAEMHALRKACPEQLAQTYVEEEMPREPVATVVIDLGAHEEALRAARTLDELATVWADLPGEAKEKLKPVQEEMKKLINDA
jgi:hypothetical protein